MTASSRLSALNLVAELLRKVNVSTHVQLQFNHLPYYQFHVQSFISTLYVWYLVCFLFLYVSRVFFFAHTHTQTYTWNTHKTKHIYETRTRIVCRVSLLQQQQQQRESFNLSWRACCAPNVISFVAFVFNQSLCDPAHCRLCKPHPAQRYLNVWARKLVQPPTPTALRHRYNQLLIIPWRRRVSSTKRYQSVGTAVRRQYEFHRRMLATFVTHDA